MRVFCWLIAGLLSLAVPARAWIQLESGISWPDGTVPMVLMFGPNKTLSDGTTWNLSAQLALDEWNRNMGRLQFTWTTSSDTTGGENNYVNEAFFAADAYGEAFGTNTLAVTIYWSNSTRITRADVLFNNKYTWDSYRGALHYGGTTLVPEFRRVALHEFGHVLGFDHPDERGQSVSSVMNASISAVEHLTTSDQDGSATIYGPGIDNQPPLPVILTQPSARTVSEGDYVSFAVSVSVTGTVRYQWKKDGQAIAGATSNLYSIAAAKLTDAGDFSVVVANAAGSVTSSAAKLTVNKAAPPSNLSGPRSTTFAEWSDSSLSVYASGNGLTYQWRRDGVNLPGATGSSLSFKATQMWDAGIYDVVVSNSGGSVTSNQATVSVLPARPVAIGTISGGGTYRVGESASVNVGVFGSSPLTIAWKRGGTVLAGQTSSSLYLYPVRETDAGSYEFFASNPLSSAKSPPIVLTILPATVPVLTVVPHDVQAELGSTVNLYAAASGAPAPSFVWTKDGVTLSGTFSNLWLSNPTAADTGLYSVKAVNSAGASAVQSFRVTVRARPFDPFFLRSPVSTTLVAGWNANFSCQLYDPLGATYRWFKDGVEIPNSNSTSLWIDSVSAASEGKYWVEATADGKTVRSAGAQLKLQAAALPFEISGQPASGTFVEGSNDMLTCYFKYPSSGFSPSVQWYKDGVAIPGATSIYFSRYPWTPGDSGDYVAKGTLSGETLTSEVAKVVVLARPAPFILVPPSDKVVPIGDSASLSVIARWGVNFQWKKNGSAIAGATGTDFSLGSVTAGSAGDYTVVVSNAAGSVESGVAHLTVGPGLAPVIDRQPWSVRSSTNASLGMSVSVRGSSPLNFQWKMNGVALPGSTSNSLSFGTPTPGNAGQYTVVISNAFGSVESEPATLEYDSRYGSPLVTLQPKNSSAVIGQTAALTAVAWGEPVPSIQWRKNGANIAGATKWKFEVTGAQLTDSGSYDAVITNSLGSVTTQSAQLTIGVDNGRIVALSARAQVGTGGDVLIPGFLIGGSTPKKLLLRALGPTLTGYGVQGALADPKLVLKALGSDTVIASNDDWSGAGADPTLPALFTQVGASSLASGSKDAALVATLAPGLYTAITSGADGGKGVALLEVFDVDPAAGKLTGISTRAIVGTGSNVLIPGIVVDGPVAKKLLIRVSGPALAQYGVQGTLADPKIELKSANGTTLQSNDNWDKTDTALTGAVAQIGLGAFAEGSKDAALLATLSAGLYTIVISGADGGSGVALVEVYDVP